MAILIPEEERDRWNISKNHVDEPDYEEWVYRTYLIVTNGISYKVLEGVCTWDDYPDVKHWRQVAREEIERLEREKNED